MMRIILDGYNFIGRDHGLRGPLEPKRKRLAERLCRYAKETGCSVLVVFDGIPHKGQEEDFCETAEADETAPIAILYSGRGKKADDLIRERAESDSTTTVVTSDRALQASVRAASAQVLFCGQFEALLKNAGV